MNTLSRRNFIKLATVSAATAGFGLPLTTFGASGKAKARVVVVGGGFGGATCAKYIRRYDPGIEVTLIERDEKFITCPFSNAVLGGIYDMQTITHGYDPLQKNHGINVIHAEMLDLDPSGKKVILSNGKTIEYDRLVISPGIDFRWNAVEGYDEKASLSIPHAWKAGQQTILLKKQLHDMANGGTVVMSVPANPFRCPPGPYERASLIAYYLQQHKPKSKLLILDAKDKFSKQPLFQQGWEKLYPGIIEWVSLSTGGKVEKLDVTSRTLMSDIGEKHKGDVINLIPPQQAGLIAHKIGLVDNTGWCPVDQKGFASKIHKHVHVIGDAAIAGKMPKSGFAANSQGKVCAAAIVAEINDIAMPDPSYVNTCYSLVGPHYGISVAAVYRYTGDIIDSVVGAGGVSPMDATETFRAQEAVYAKGWYDSITMDSFS